MFKILQARLQQYVNRELPDVQAGFRKTTIYIYISVKIPERKLHFIPDNKVIVDLDVIKR